MSTSSARGFRRPSRPARTPRASAPHSATKSAGRRSSRSPRAPECLRRPRSRLIPASGTPPSVSRRMVDERILAERLIGYDTSRPDDLVAAAGFVKGWLESRDIEVHDYEHNGLPVLVADVGPRDKEA